MDGQRGLRASSHCEAACARLWGAGLKLSTVSKGVPDPPRGVNLIDLSRTGPLGQNRALSRVPSGPSDQDFTRFLPGNTFRSAIERPPCPRWDC